MSLEDVGEVCAVEDVFEGREDADPDAWSVITGYESVKQMLVKALNIRSGCRGVGSE